MARTHGAEIGDNNLGLAIERLEIEVELMRDGSA